MSQYDQDLLPSNSVPLDECIRSMMRRENDQLERNFLLYREVSRDVYNDLNLKAIKYTERRLIEVDKRTNRITVPDYFLHTSSISVIEDGVIKPMIIDPNITDDIVDVSLNKDCGCECGCRTSLCGQIKHYEAIQETVIEDLPGGGTKSFNKVTRKILYPDGTMNIETTEPVRLIENGTWTAVIEDTKKIYLCKLKVKKCGCVIDCEENHDLVGKDCFAESFACESGCPVSCYDTKRYNYSEMGNVINLPSDFAYDKVLLRFYLNLGVKQIRIPVLARPTFLRGLKAFAAEFNDKVSRNEKTILKTNYNNSKDSLAIDMHKFSIAEYYSVLTPNRIMP